MSSYRVIVATLAGLLLPVVAQAQIPNCAGSTTKAGIWQVGTKRVVGAYVQSSRPLDGCAIKQQVEGWIDQHPNGGAVISDGYSNVVVARWEQGVPEYGRWVVLGKHWIIWFGAWHFQGWSNAETTVMQSSTGYECDEGATNQWGTSEGCGTGNTGGWNSPIIIDVDRDGYCLTNVREGVLFDMNVDGTPEPTAWTCADDDDAFLVLDAGADGIRDAGDLFGDRRVAFRNRDGDPVYSFNGFDALQRLHGPEFAPAFDDGVIDAQDSSYARLRLWTDLNHNGIAEDGELRAAAEVMSAISVKARLRRKTDRYGNQFRLQGELTYTDGRIGPVYDIWLSASDENTLRQSRRD